jgi:putative nucleotidyltransferase with HDIG domain
LSLFETMPSYDRQHALIVARALESEGHDDPDVLAAALLHDVGKTAHQDGALRLVHRVAVVLMRALGSGVLESVAEDQPGSWRHPFHVQRFHASIGADLARNAGCSPRTVQLIRCHEDRIDQTEDPELAALQAADNAA